MAREAELRIYARPVGTDDIPHWVADVEYDDDGAVIGAYIDDEESIADATCTTLWQWWHRGDIDTPICAEGRTWFAATIDRSVGARGVW